MYLVSQPANYIPVCVQCHFYFQDPCLNPFPDKKKHSLATRFPIKDSINTVSHKQSNDYYPVTSHMHGDRSNVCFENVTTRVNIGANPSLPHREHPPTHVLLQTEQVSPATVTTVCLLSIVLQHTEN